MKYTTWLVIFFAGYFTASAELSQKQLKAFKKLVQIDSVTESSDKARGKKFEVLRVDFSSEDNGLDGIFFRIAVEVTDRKTKEVYLVKEISSFRSSFPDTYMGEGDWKLRIPCGERRLKITGCALEYGVKEGRKFAPFMGEYDDVKSFEELTDRSTTPFPQESDLDYTYMVDDY